MTCHHLNLPRLMPLLVAVFCLSLLMAISPLQARETAWVQHGQEAKSRIIGSMQADNADTVWLAFEVALADGWKTYWRSPGEAGLPVIISSSGQALPLAYPTPMRFELFGLQTFGYSKKVVIPFQLDRKKLDEAAQLDISFMVCKDICIPIEYSSPMPKKKFLDYTITIEEWLGKVPSEPSGTGLKIVRHRVVGPKGQQRVIVDVAGMEKPAAADLLIEGPAGMTFSKPSFVKKGSFIRFVLAAEGGSDMPDLRQEKLRMTVIDGTGQAIDSRR